MTASDRKQAISLIVQALGFHRAALEQKSDDDIYALLQRAQQFIVWEAST